MPTDIGAPNALITELKTRARLRLNSHKSSAASTAPRAAPSPDAATTELRLRDCLNQVSHDVGFANWDQARQVLGGLAQADQDMGTIWYAPRCAGLLSHWFAHHDDAKLALATAGHRVLLPYKRQFIVVDGHFIRELGMQAEDPAWHAAGRDLAQAYGGAAWLDLCEKRLRAMRGATQSLAA
jgi:hypothetical protein